MIWLCHEYLGDCGFCRLGTTFILSLLHNMCESFETRRQATRYYWQAGITRGLCVLTTYSLDIRCLSVKVISLNVGSNLCLPLVSIVQQLLLVVQELFMCLSRKLKVRTLKTQRKNHHCHISYVNDGMWNIKLCIYLLISTILLMKMMYFMFLTINI